MANIKPAMEQMKFFWLKTNPPSSKLHVRDLKWGVKVPLGDGKVAEVECLEIMDGSNGELAYIGGSKSAVAIKIHFHDHTPVIAHPNDTVDYF